MRLGEILVGHGVVSADTVAEALERQRVDGGRLGEILVEMGAVTEARFTEIMARIDASTPRQPRNIAETGINDGQLLALMLKFMLVESRESTTDIAHAMRLPRRIVIDLVAQAVQRKLILAVGSRTIGEFQDIRYGLSQEGRNQAADALRQNQYLGPAPVPLAAFQAQIARQRIGDEFITADRLRGGLGGLQTPPHYIRKLLPAINAGRTILLFGPPGNGKTTVASRLAGLFQQVVYIPYAVEIAGQIMKVFDSGLHQPVLNAAEGARLEDRDIGGGAYDDRWVGCRRPFAMAGGELTLETLDMKFDPETGFYDAPIQVKALNGVFLVDDFGRQAIPPEALLNRWIVPMESRVDFLRLHTGATFTLPFDALLVFSTNIDPKNLMDAALLRRIPYKVLLYGPSREEYFSLFRKEAQGHGLEISDEVIDFVIDALTVKGDFGLAYFQPRFVCDQVEEICRCFDTDPVLTRELAFEALSNLYVQIEEQANEGAAAAPRA